MLSAHTQRNMASFAEAPAGDVAKGTSRHARTRGASTRALEGGRARPPARSPQLIPSVPILDVCFHRREDLQDQVRAVPRRRGRRRPQAGTSAATRAGTARMPTGDPPPPVRPTPDPPPRKTSPADRTPARFPGGEPGAPECALESVPQRTAFAFFRFCSARGALTASLPKLTTVTRIGPQPRRSVRPRLRHDGGFRVLRREQEQGRQVGRGHALRLPAQPEEVHPGHEDGLRRA